jgi:polyhydroxyalkanoate synthesis repressor PhaR
LADTARGANLRQIKRYPNRKFYDTEDKRYASLSRIADLVTDGEEIQVLDNATGEDITSVVLSEILRRQESGSSFLSPALLTALVRRGAAGWDQLRASLRSSLDAAHILEDELQQRVDTMAERGEISLWEVLDLREEIAARARMREARAEERITQDIEGSLRRLDVPTRRDLGRLDEQLAEIEAKLDSLLSTS